MPFKTKWRPRVAELPASAIVHDRWDERWGEEARTKIPRLQALTDAMAEVSPGGPDAMADLYYELAKGDPRLATAVRPDRAVNRLVAQQLLESDGVRDLRRFTAGSQVQSALGCITMQPHLVAIYEKVLEKAQEKAEEAQRTADAVDELLKAGFDQDGDEVQLAQEAAGAAQDALDAALDDATAKTGQMCRKAAEEASDEAEERAMAMAAWGSDPASWQKMDPEQYLAMADRLADSDLTQIAKLFGAMHNLAIGSRREKVDGIPTEVFSVELGNDLGRLLPSEYAGLILDELEDDFLQRYGERRLMQYKLRSNEVKSKGAIILLEDSSGSMYGLKHCWAKAFGLALGRIARDEDRGFHAIEFGSKGEHLHHAFPDRASWSVDATISYAESFLNGGTDFESVLDAAVTILADEFDQTGKVTGDIVMLSDGLAGVSAGWLAGFLAEQERLRFKVYVLVVGGRSDSTPESILKFTNYVGSVTSFTDGTDVAHIFKEVGP